MDKYKIPSHKGKAKYPNKPIKQLCIEPPTSPKIAVFVKSINTAKKEKTIPVAQRLSLVIMFDCCLLFSFFPLFLPNKKITSEKFV
jgi:hypothetical protein